MNPVHIPAQYRIVFYYLIVGAIWIFFSDQYLLQLASNEQVLSELQSTKGWCFVAVTAILLFFLIRRDIRRIEFVNQQLVDSHDQSIQGWIKVIDTRHQETKDHTERVTQVMLALAKAADINDSNELKRIERASMLHDIGKVGVPDAVLIKPGKLTDDEWQLMKRHPKIAYNVMKNIYFLKDCLDIPYCHHERWDGSGYPRGLKGEQIPWPARLFAIVDVWDSLIHPRVYKQAWPEGKVLAFIREQSGSHFDPKAVDIFLNNYPQIKQSIQGVAP